MNKSAYVIECRQITKAFQDAKSKLHVLTGVNLQVKRGVQIAIMGRSGSGKTTLLQMLGGLDIPTSGEVFINGNDLQALTDSRQRSLRNKALGFIYQQHHLLPEFSALENVAMPMLIGGEQPKTALQQAAVLLAEVGLSDRLHHRPGTLSGGERQRVAVARALVMDPDCVLADEPTGSLDSENAEHTLQLIKKMSNDRGTTFVVVTHDLELAQTMDQIYHLEDGKLQLET